MTIIDTPPLAPVTTTGPLAGARSSCSSRETAKAAVKPAVPSIIASRSVKPAGSGSTQSAGTRAQPARPPSCAMPSS